MSLAPVRREIPEYLDSPRLPADEVARNLRDLRRLNAIFGGRRFLLGHVAWLLRGVPAGSRVRVLDAGTGGGDLPLAITAWGRRRRLRIEVRGVDRSPPVVRYARAAVATDRAIRIEEGDALALEPDEGAYEVCVSALTLHHLTPAQGARLLRLFDRAARLGFVVIDLVRSWPAYAGVWFATRIAATARTTRHDGPASVLRAYTVPELRAMIGEAGVRGVRVVRHPFFRVALVGTKPSAGETR